MPAQPNRPNSFQGNRVLLEELDTVAEGKLAQDLFGLPSVFNDDTQKRNAKDECSLCLTAFSVVSFLGVGSKEVICKRCGSSVCDTCSKNKRQIARLDPVAYTVCDMCDTQLDNVSEPLRQNLSIFSIDDLTKVFTYHTLIGLASLLDAYTAENIGEESLTFANVPSIAGETQERVP